MTILFVKQPQDLSRRRRRQSSHNSTDEASSATLNAKKPRFDPAQLETDGVQPTPLASLPNLNSTSLGPPPPLRALWPPPTSPSSQLAYHQGKLGNRVKEMQNLKNRKDLPTEFFFI